MSLTDLRSCIRCQHGYTPTVCLVLGSVISIMALGCSKAERDRPPSDGEESPSPVAVFWSYPGYPGPDQPVRSGLLAAAWQDGRVVRVETHDDLGRRYVTGMLGAEDTQRLRTLVAQDVAFLTEHKAPLVPDDSAFERIYVSDLGKSARASFEASLAPPALIAELRAIMTTAPLADMKEAPAQWEHLRSLCGSP